MTAPVLAAAVLAALAVAAALAPPLGSRLPRVPGGPRGSQAASRAASRSGTVSPDGSEAPGEFDAPGGRSLGTGAGESPADAAARPGTVVTAAASLGVGTGVALLVGSSVGVALGVVAAPLAWRWFARLEPAAARRRRERLERDLPLLVDLLAACLRAGQAPGSALAAVTASLEPGPLRTETSRVVARLRLGGDPLGTWQALGDHPQLGPLGRTVARALDGGASVADAMADLARELRRTRRAEVQARARAVGARAAAPLGLCLLPAFVLVGIVPVVAGSLGALLQR